jgi:thiol:disulfide interchange protein
MGQFPSLRWSVALVLLSAGATGATGCRKTLVEVPMQWQGDLDVALASAKAQNKPLFVYFGASWDTAAKELEHVTFVDPEVRALLGRDFVSMRVDASDDENPDTRRLQERFKVVGDPTIIVLGPDGTSEIVRFNEFIKPRVLARALRAATKEDAVREARFEAAIRERAREALWAEESRKAALAPQGPAVTITLSPDPAEP